ncbi:MAG: HYR domain-containing protein [Nitrosopumilus sp.]|nr:HYR domain-containing protein [Nitrosopumilus sp.]MDA7944766.1 HYR domain-containing protein [Nitrosopumilus sp.]MDA7954662.1 HYR domain-containing protein [Nitrosopumilus sp.]MDA7973667.1 HYR domain-containing protein [Nitrosopumilus sp.]MDA7997614.1 HYR domain-containing protein [Nitrosopumilus sp.]
MRFGGIAKTVALASLAVAFGLQAGSVHAAPPTIVAPADMEVEAEWYFTRVNIGTPTVSADSGVDYMVTNTAPPQFLLGTTVITWLVEDDNGGRASDTQSVTVVDTKPPECPDGHDTAGPFDSLDGRAVSVDLDAPPITDKADVVVDVASSHDDDFLFPVGSTTVTFTGVDDSGNSVECDVVVIVTIPVITGLVLDPTYDSIRASWDGFNDTRKYRAVLLDSSDNVVEDARISKTSHTFPDLDPGTEYEVRVSSTKYQKVKAVATATTLLPPLYVRDSFDSTDGWSHVATTHEPGFNMYALSTDASVGNPAPSAKISGDGANTNFRVEKWFNTSAHTGATIYFGINYKSATGPALLFVVDSGDGTPQYTKPVRVEAGSTGWGSLEVGISAALRIGDKARVQIYLYDLDADDGGHTLYLDNLLLSGTDLSSGFRGGSAGADDPAWDAFERALESVLDGRSSPSDHLGVSKPLGEYEDLFRMVLTSLGITG